MEAAKEHLRKIGDWLHPCDFDNAVLVESKEAILEHLSDIELYKVTAAGDRVRWDTLRAKYTELWTARAIVLRQKQLEESNKKP